MSLRARPGPVILSEPPSGIVRSDRGSRFAPGARHERSRQAAARDARAARMLAASRAAPERERHAMRQQVVVEFMDVARSIALRFHTGVSDRADLEQVAYVGLVKAVERFDGACGHDLLSFVVPTVSGELKRYVRDTTWSVRPPRALQELHLEVREAVEGLAQSLGRPPTAGEVASDLGRPLALVEEAMRCPQARRAASLDAPAQVSRTARAEPTAALGTNLASDAADLDQADFALILARACRSLTEEDRRVLYLRYYCDLSQTEIAKRTGVSQMQVSRMLSRILVLLRESIAVNPFRI